MVRVPRRFARVGAAADLPDSAAFDAYVGPAGEIIVDVPRGLVSLQNGVTPGGILLSSGGGGYVIGLPTDGVTDCRALLIAAQAARDVVRIPSGTYFVSDVIDILDGKTWIFDNVTLVHSDISKSFLRAVGKKRFALLGKLRIQGLRTTNQTGAEAGVILENCEQYEIQNVVVSGLAGKGFDIRGTTAGTYYGNKGKFSNVLAVGCNVGIELQAGSGAEYGTWSNCSAVENAVGIKMAAGNHVWNGGTVTDNAVGIDLLAGSNHLHGSFVGTLINHNVVAIRGTDVTMGHLFADCRFYDGAIEFTGCSKILFLGGTMDGLTFKNDIGSAGGFSHVRGVHFPGGTTLSAVSGDAPGKLQLVRNFGPGISRYLNMPTEHYVSMYRATVTQALSTSSDLIFHVDLLNRSNDYNISNGVFTAPVDGFYRISYTVLINGTGVDATAVYLSAQLDQGGGYGDVSLALPTKFGTTKLRFIDSFEVSMLAGNKIKLRANGTASMTFGDSSWLSEFRVEKTG